MAKVTRSEKYTVVMNGKEARALDALLSNVAYGAQNASPSSRFLSNIQDALREAFGLADGHVFDEGPVLSESTGIVVTGTPRESNG